ncbi:ATP-binding cassette domain-containing protein [Nocardioides sp. NPDC057772]|uniref:ATP-binding cassette domain-containing protein n=1 Tax=Nocardioides sp. NPDC057772 TaxID=3346245 RepID=UPI00366C37C6
MTTTELAVSASGLVKTFGDFTAVDGIDLEIRRGEVFGVLGPNGAGKTTTLKMLATLLPIDAGTAEIFGVDVKAHPHQVRQLVGVTGQYASVDENLTASENLVLFGRLLGMSGKAARAASEELLESWRHRSCLVPRSSSSTSRRPAWTRGPAARCGTPSVRWWPAVPPCC